jgi:hypothetical protein
MGIRRCSIREFGFMRHRDQRPNKALQLTANPLRRRRTANKLAAAAATVMSLNSMVTGLFRH